MTIDEFSNGFDVLVDSYRRFKDFDDRMALDSIEFSEYEKSIHLTSAQDTIIKEIYDENYVPISFESNELARRELSNLVRDKTYTSQSESSTIPDTFKHYTYKLGDDCWFVVFEQVVLSSTNACYNNKVLMVCPTTHDEYNIVKGNPFKGPNDRRVLRLDIGDSVELISKYDIAKYYMRYLSKPEPIVLCELESNKLSINGVSSPQTCKLSSLLHQEILERAVKAALSTRVINTKNNGK